MTPHVFDRLSAYLDGELPAAERTSVGAHLEECADCARRLEELAAVDEAARGLPAEPPEGYFEGFPTRVRSRLEPRPLRRPWALPAWTLAAAAALLLVVVTPLTLHKADLGPAPPAPPAAPSPATPAPEKEARGKATALGALAEQPKREAAARSEDKGAGTPAEATPVERDLLVRQRTAQAQPAAPQAAGFAPEPSSMGDESAQARSQATREALDHPVAAGEAGATEGVVAEGRKDKDLKKAAAPAPAGRYAELLARTASTTAEARALRDAWRELVRADPEGPRADEGRVRAIEAGAAAWKLGGDPADRAAARRDAVAYLARSDAAQRARVEAILRELGP